MQTANPLEAKSLPMLLAAIRQPTESTSPGGAVITSSTVHHHNAGCVCWCVVRDKCGVNVTGSRIICWEIEGSDSSGWTATPLRESPDLRHVDCPLEYLPLVKVLSAVWRDRVWAHHEAALTLAVEGKVAG